MYVKLDLESSEPIYTQLVHEIIAGIARDELQPGEALPSVRTMAKDLGINLHTVNKAYQQLKQEGFIQIHRQKGVVINPDGFPPADEDYIANLTSRLHPLIAESITRGMQPEDFLQMTEQIFNSYKGKDGINQ